MKYGEFKTKCAAVLGRGQASLAKVPAAIADAVREIERVAHWDPAYHTMYAELNPEAVYPRTIRIGPWGVKDIDFVKVKGEDDSYTEVLRVEPRSQSWAPGVGVPTEYWRAQEDLLIVNNVPDRRMPLIIGWWEKSYTLCADDEDSWLLRHYADVLEAGTLHFAFLSQRNSAKASEYYALFRQRLDTMLMEQEDREFENAERSMRPDPMRGYC